MDLLNFWRGVGDYVNTDAVRIREAEVAVAPRRITYFQSDRNARMRSYVWSTSFKGWLKQGLLGWMVRQQKTEFGLRGWRVK
ncbi:hypothetical protein [Spirosoma fluminis]